VVLKAIVSRRRREQRIIAWPVAPIKSIVPTKPGRLEFPCITFPSRKVCGRNGHNLSGWIGKISCRRSRRAAKLQYPHGRRPLAIPQPHTNYSKRRLSYSGVVLWNSLPLNIRQSLSLNQFKTIILTVVLYKFYFVFFYTRLPCKAGFYHFSYSCSYLQH